MKKNCKHTKKFGPAVCSIFMLIGASLLWTACPNTLNAPAGNTASGAYTQLPFGALDMYLKNASPASDGIFYVEVIGTAAADFKGTSENETGEYEGGTLGKIIAANSSKKVALKLPNAVAGLSDMSYCFTGCKNLISVDTVPESVTNMENCFSGCSGLIKGPVISKNVVNMEGCFSGCTSLDDSPVIPEGVTNMNWCFYECASLTQSPAIPASVINIKGCFTRCINLTRAPVLPPNIRDLFNCFSGCTSLIGAPVIPENVTHMKNSFEGCTSLTEGPVIPSGVTHLYRCFRNCTNLTSAVLKCDYTSSTDDGTPVFEDVFQGCSSLEDGRIRVSPGQLSVYQGAAHVMGVASSKFGAEYENVLFSQLDTYLKNNAPDSDGIYYIYVKGLSASDLIGNYNGDKPSALGKVIAANSPKKIMLKLPDTIENLTDMSFCFASCSNLVGVAAIPYGVTRISFCFKKCSGLTEAPVIPMTVEKMASCFSECTVLNKAPAIPANVENLNWCFSECKNLTQAPDIAEGVGYMQGTFFNCTQLINGPVVPRSVLQMTHCFYGCTGLRSAMLKCNHSTGLIEGEGCFEKTFKDCPSLDYGGIKVRSDQLSDYKLFANIMGTTADRFSAL